MHTLRGRGVVRVLQGEQKLELLLLEQTSDRLLLRRWRRRRGRLGLRRRKDSYGSKETPHPFYQNLPVTSKVWLHLRESPAHGGTKSG